MTTFVLKRMKELLVAVGYGWRSTTLLMAPSFSIAVQKIAPNLEVN
jgi:hypothetical protein